MKAKYSMTITFNFNQEMDEITDCRNVQEIADIVAQEIVDLITDEKTVAGYTLEGTEVKIQ